MTDNLPQNTKSYVVKYNLTEKRRGGLVIITDVESEEKAREKAKSVINELHNEREFESIVEELTKVQGCLQLWEWY